MQKAVEEGRKAEYWRGRAAGAERWAEHLDLRLEFERARLASLNPEPFAPVSSYKKGDVVDAKRYGRCEVVRVGPKNVKVRQLTGPTKGWEWAVPPHELRLVPPEEPATSD